MLALYDAAIASVNDAAASAAPLSPAPTSIALVLPPEGANVPILRVREEQLRPYVHSIQSTRVFSLSGNDVPFVWEGEVCIS